MSGNLLLSEKIILIGQMIAGNYGYTLDDLNSKSQKQEIVEPRQLAHYVCIQEVKGASLQLIGSLIGGKDHATVIHSKKSVQNSMDTVKGFTDVVNKFIEDAKRITTKAEKIKIHNEYVNSKLLVKARIAAIRNKLAYRIYYI